MKIGLLGGSFNPPHPGHIYISNLAIKKLGLDQVWWLPTSQNPLKDPEIYEGYEKRVSKCQEIVINNPKIYIKEFDYIYTHKLILKLKSKYKNVEFFWIMGADNLSTFHKWHNFKEIIKNISLIIFSRETSALTIKKTKAWNFIAKSSYKMFYTKNYNLSSSEIRKQK